MAAFIPPCGVNERLNAAVHGGLALLYLLALVYHGGATVEHLIRHWRKGPPSP